MLGVLPGAEVPRAAVIGTVRNGAARVVARTVLVRRLVDALVGELLPRIC